MWYHYQDVWFGIAANLLDHLSATTSFTSLSFSVAVPTANTLPAANTANSLSLSLNLCSKLNG